MVPVHGLLIPAGRPCARHWRRDCTEERLVGFWADLSRVNRIGIQERDLVGVKIVLEKKGQVPANAPVHLKIRSKLNVILEIWSNVGVAQVGVACTASCAPRGIAEQEARKAI